MLCDAFLHVGLTGFYNIFLVASKKSEPMVKKPYYDDQFKVTTHLENGQNGDRIRSRYKSTKHQAFYKWKSVHEKHQTTKVTAIGDIKAE